MSETFVESEIEADEDETVSKDAEKGPLDTSSCVQVAVRVRPLLAMEAGSDRCLEVFQQSIQLGGQSGPRLTFDRVFDSNTQQSAIFTDCGASLVESCLQGYNATILAYGQTGSGKTFTMMGADDQALLVADGDQHLSGIIPRSISMIFQKLEERSNASEFRVRLQFLEIYGEDIRDLLVPGTGGDKLTIRDLGGSHEPEVVGATQELVSSSSEALKCLSRGMLRRVTGATAMNETSSRSHAILSVLVEQSTKVIDETDDEERFMIKQSKFNFVDLAGSERIKRTQAEGQRMKEGIDINKGLLVLGNVISALGDPRKRGTFVPYRDSKLTRLLKGSLGGNHKTLMIACVSPSEDNLEESLSCLRYANRAKNIQNNAVVNVDANTRLIAGLQTQVKTLSTALLKSIDGIDVLAEGPLSRDVLQAWAQGNLDPERAIESGGSVSPCLSTNRVSPRKVDADCNGNEILSLRNELRRTRKHQEEAEEQLYAAKAEKELYQLQLSVVDENASSDQESDHLAQLFLDKANVYEKEIGQLRQSLREANAKLDYMRETPEVPFSIEKAQRQAEEERRRLNIISEKFSMDHTPQYPVPCSDENIDDNDYLSPASKKFIAEADEEEEEDNHRSSTTVGDESASDRPTESIENDEEDIRANLIDLSKGIAAKEELIDQLKFSEEKYANMRGFYEEKLKQMESALSENEAEREQLLLKLRNTHASDATSLSSLRDLLKEKDQNIDNLRKKHKQLVGLTTVSSRNQVQITRLQDDVREMKRRKVLLQKQITRERRDHANEIKQLQKEAVKKDRELSRLQKVTADKENEARKAHLVSKSRLDELGQLRAKYRDSEKRLRVLSVKQGVMAKAGIDPLLVGRRSNSAKSSTPTVVSTSAKHDNNINGIRKYFDEKVAEIARKEAIADKLAHEWEDHFELTSKKAMMSDTSPISEEVQALDLQIKFKEDRIRQLARHLGSVHATESSNGHMTQSVDSFLCEDNFMKHLKDMDAGESMQIVAKILFGMIVKERRRVSALARAASSLDERLLAAEKEVTVRESAFKNYIREQNEEATVASLKKQEHILSLMDMVKEDTERSSFQDSAHDATMLVLANERIASLEQQITDLRSREATLDCYNDKVNELENSLSAKNHECREMQNRLYQIGMGLKKVSDELRDKTGTDNLESLSRLRALISGPYSPDTEAKRRSFESPLQNVDILTSSIHNTDDDSDLPEWASDIMADLVYIAEGRPPPSMDKSIPVGHQPARPALHISPPSDSEDFSYNVNQEGQRNPGESSSLTAPTSTDKAGRKAMSREIADRLEKIVIPGQDKCERETDHRDPDDDVEKHQSVFERLVSPSQYTGTQREKYFSSRKKRQETADEAATRLLDHLLEGDDEPEGTRNESMLHHSHSVYEDYTQVNVFERLQKTTTQAFAVKHTPNQDALTNGGSHITSSSSTTPGHEDTKSSSYTKLNVFERLQRTTTEAFSKKKNTKNKHEKK